MEDQQQVVSTPSAAAKWKHPRHINKETTTTTWLTPPELLEWLGPFDLDPCCPENMPWNTAKHMLTPRDDGLATDWKSYGRVWLNPPFGRGIDKWLDKLAAHGHGVALVPGNIEVNWFQDYVFRRADMVYFFRHRLHFLRLQADGGTYRPKGAVGNHVLAFYGDTQQHWNILYNLKRQNAGWLMRTKQQSGGAT
jgi:hypothetical protein